MNRKAFMFYRNSDFWPDETRWRAAWDLVVRERGFGFFDGGCLILAEALKMGISGAKVGTLFFRGEVDHYIISLPMGRWADAGGVASSSEEILERYMTREFKKDRVECFRVSDSRVYSSKIPRSVNLSRRLTEILF